MQLPTAQLLSYGFGSDAAFEGQLLGALERLESGGALRILDALFIQNDPETGELVAANLRGDGAGSIVGPLLTLRLDVTERRRITEKTLRDHSRGIPADTIRALAATLEPGASVAAVLVDHRWLQALQDAGSRTGGRLLASEFVNASELAELAPDLLRAAQARKQATPAATGPVELPPVGA
jgi:hypothetical protein